MTSSDSGFQAMGATPTVRGIVQAFAAKYGPEETARALTGATASPPAGVPPLVASDACPHCHGVGYFRSAAAWGEPRFGRAEACMICAGYGTVNRYALALREQCGVPDTLWQRFTFATYDPERTPQARQARNAVWLWAHDGVEQPPDPPFLALMGGTGLGKTHLAVAAVSTLVERRQEAVFVTVPRLLEELRATQRPQAEQELAMVRQRVEDVPYLVLDDLGADRPTDFAAEQLYLVIDRRWQRRQATLVTSNTPPQQIERRIRSRILDSHLSRLVALDGPDQRLVAEEA